MDSVFEVRVDHTAFGAVALTAPWAFRIPAGDEALLYAVRHGGGWLGVATETPERIRAGSVISLPGGHAHTLRDSLTTPLPARAEPLKPEELDAVALDAPAGDGKTLLVVGRVPAKGNPLPDVLPLAIHVPPEETSTNQRLQHLLRAAVLEYEAPERARTAILKRLSEILAIELIEFSLSQTAGRWRTRAVDERIRRALSAIHAHPERPWTLASLAKEALLSRSAFASLFRSVVGETPVSYLNAIRMQRAAADIRAGNELLYLVAEAAGYKSEASFSKAFRRFMGISPAEYRRIHTA